MARLFRVRRPRWTRWALRGTRVSEGEPQTKGAPRERARALVLRKGPRCAPIGPTRARESVFERGEAWVPRDRREQAERTLWPKARARVMEERERALSVGEE